MLEEFDTKLSDIELQRNKKSNESFREYLYSLMKIRNPVELDDESLIDSRQNKSCLYQATTLNELKNQIKVYEKIRSFNKPQTVQNFKDFKTNDKKDENKKSEQRRCFKCGDVGHLSNNCPSNQIKCFKCNSYGHKSYECSNQNAGRVKIENTVRNTTNSCMVQGHQEFVQEDFNHSEYCRNFKNINFKNFVVPAIIDSGSDVCIIRLDVFRKLKDVNFKREHKEFLTASNVKMISKGYFIETVFILEFSLKFYVTDSSPYPAAIGTDVLKDTYIILGKNKVKILKRGETKEGVKVVLWKEFGEKV